MKTAKRLAEILAVRLNSVMPEGIVVTADDGSIGPVADGNALGGTDFNGWVQEGARFDAADGDAMLAALHAVQDGVVRVRKSPWPGEDPDLPEPGVAVSDHRIFLWFGEEGDPVVRLEPIDIRDI
jgi:hypothetical protein